MKKWLKRNALSILIGCLIGALAGWGHIRSAQEWQEQKRQLAEEAREYDREVELERARWVEIENEEMWNEVMQEEIAYATEMEKINLYDPDIPKDIQDAAWKYGEQYNICPEFLIAVAKRESEFNPEAVNGSCVGLMQVSLRWHTDRMERCQVTEEEMWTVDGSMHVAADYLAELFDEYEDAALVLMIYNGDSRAELFAQGDCEMSGYASDILTYSRELEEKHGKTGQSAYGSRAKEVVILRV